ncbi:hypothetical protein EBR21_09270, partial [bacterium]|nr:hypothetical protein [bacterium]
MPLPPDTKSRKDQCLFIFVPARLIGQGEKCTVVRAHEKSDGKKCRTNFNPAEARSAFEPSVLDVHD